MRFHEKPHAVFFSRKGRLRPSFLISPLIPPCFGGNTLMRRQHLFLVLIAAVPICAFFVWRSSAGAPQTPDNGSASERRPGPNLPIRDIVLFNSGVGYFQREGSVEGDARVDLQFPAGEVNDLLKSLVLQDLGQGNISTISYDSLEPI